MAHGVVLIKPKDIKVKDLEGVEHTYIISRVPAIPAREIIYKYPTTAMPKIGDYSQNEKTMLQLMQYVAVHVPQGHLTLSTVELIHNHVPDWETLVEIEKQMLIYNCSFFLNEKASTFLDVIVKLMKARNSKTSMDLSAQSSAPDKPA